MSDPIKKKQNPGKVEIDVTVKFPFGAPAAEMKYESDIQIES